MTLSEAILLSEPGFPPLYDGDSSSVYLIIVPILQMRTLKQRGIR